MASVAVYAAERVAPLHRTEPAKADTWWGAHAVHTSVGRVQPKLQALVYDILPSTIAVFSYAIGSKKTQLTSSFFVGALKPVLNWANVSSRT